MRRSGKKSGRTTRMVQEACKKAKQTQKSVYIIVHRRGITGYIRWIVRNSYPECLKLIHVVTPLKGDVFGNVIGIERDRVFVDHKVYEKENQV